MSSFLLLSTLLSVLKPSHFLISYKDPNWKLYACTRVFSSNWHWWSSREIIIRCCEHKHLTRTGNLLALFRLKGILWFPYAMSTTSITYRLTTLRRFHPTIIVVQLTRSALFQPASTLLRALFLMSRDRLRLLCEDSPQSEMSYLTYSFNFLGISLFCHYMALAKNSAYGMQLK